MKQVTYKVIDSTGIHARPASLLTTVAASYQDDVEIEYKGKKVTMKSIMGIMSLAVPKGGEFNIIVNGENEEKVIEELEKTLKENKIIE